MTDPSPIPGSARVAVAADPHDEADLHARARRMAASLSLPLVTTRDEPACDLRLTITQHRLELRVVRGGASLRGGRAVTFDLIGLDTRSGAGRRLSQPLLKAIGLRKGTARPHVLDATVGFGEDAWLLASAGCRVTAVERSPVVAALLRDALDRARNHDPATADRVTLHIADAVEALAQLAGDHRPDVVYIDPMFPGRRKAAERKPMRVLRWLVGEDPDSAALLSPALAAAGQRVVVKRPAKAPPLADRPPAVTHRGKAVRYDVYPATPQ